MRRAICLLLLVSILLSACSLLSPAQETPGAIDIAPAPSSTATSDLAAPTSTGATTEVVPTTPNEVTTEVVTTQSASEPSLPSATPTPNTVEVLPYPASAAWEVIARGLDRPVGMADAGDGSGRLFILEQTGQIRIWQMGSLLPEPFLDLRGTVACCGERGLLGMAFHPDYVNNGYFYVNYTLEMDGNLFTRIARYQVSVDANRADPESELTLLEIQQPYENHNGGGLAFGPDGYLYIATGDGGSGGDPLGNGQSLTTLLGKLLRIDVDTGAPYAIPADNPFATGGGQAEIWAYGLRNPWRFSFDHLTGGLYIGDVGQGDWEEIDFLPAGYPGGANFGWNIYEGVHHYSGAPDPGTPLIFPVAEYGHDAGQSVTGGFVYRGAELPDWYGVYLYGDFASGKVWGLLRLVDGSWQNSLLFETGALISSFGQDENGEIYLVNYNGELLRLVSR
jgi:glucose/arabinose dehydrogenase